MRTPEADRHRRVTDTFVELADTLASDYDVADFLILLVTRCGEILQVDTAGVLLESPDGSLQLAAALSEEMEVIERVEMDQGTGPCMQAYREAEQVIAEDLDALRDHWPTVVPQLLALGMRAGYAFPLRLRDDCIGALNLYRRQPGPFDEDDIRLAQAFADVAAIGILQERKVTAAERRADHLQHALESRIVIEQAKGILAQQHGLTPEHAFERMRTYARNHRTPLHALAQAVVDGVARDIPVRDRDGSDAL